MLYSIDINKYEVHYYYESDDIVRSNMDFNVGKFSMKYFENRKLKEKKTWFNNLCCNTVKEICDSFRASEH